MLTSPYCHPLFWCRYAAYLKTLPSGPADGFDHPLFWSLDELDLLSKSSTRDVRELVRPWLASK